MILNLRSLQNAQGAGAKSREQRHTGAFEDIKVHNDLRIFWLDLIKATMLWFTKKKRRY